MKKLIVSSVLAFITFSAQAAAFQVTSNEIKTGEQLTTLDWPPESPDNQYHLNK